MQIPILRWEGELQVKPLITDAAKTKTNYIMITIYIYGKLITNPAFGKFSNFLEVTASLIAVAGVALAVRSALAAFILGGSLSHFSIKVFLWSNATDQSLGGGALSVANVGIHLASATAAATLAA